MADVTPATGDFTAASQAAEAAALEAEGAEPVAEESFAAPSPDSAELWAANRDRWASAGEPAVAEPVEPAEEPAEKLGATVGDVERALDEAGLSHLKAAELEEFLRGRPDLQEQYFSAAAETPADLARNAALADSLRRQAAASEAALENLVGQGVDMYEAGHDMGQLIEQLEAAFGPGNPAAVRLAEYWAEDEADVEPLSAEEWLEQRVAEGQAAQQYQAEQAYAAQVEAAERQMQERLEQYVSPAEMSDEQAAVRMTLLPLVEGLLARSPDPAAALEDPDGLFLAAAEAQRVEEQALEQARTEERFHFKADPWAPTPTEAQREAWVRNRVAELTGGMLDARRLLPPPTLAEVGAKANHGLLAGERRKAMFGEEGNLAEVFERGMTEGPWSAKARGKAAPRDFAHERQVVAALKRNELGPAGRVAAFTEASGGTPAPRRQQLPPGAMTYEDWADSWGA